MVRDAAKKEGKSPPTLEKHLVEVREYLCRIIAQLTSSAAVPQPSGQPAESKKRPRDGKAEVDDDIEVERVVLVKRPPQRDEAAPTASQQSSCGDVVDSKNAATADSGTGGGIALESSQSPLAGLADDVKVVSKKRRYEHASSAFERLATEGVMPMAHEPLKRARGDRRTCVNCSRYGRLDRKTPWFCIGCDGHHLCFDGREDDCYHQWHADLANNAQPVPKLARSHK